MGLIRPALRERDRIVQYMKATSQKTNLKNTFLQITKLKLSQIDQLPSHEKLPADSSKLATGKFIHPLLDLLCRSSIQRLGTSAASIRDKE